MVPLLSRDKFREDNYFDLKRESMQLFRPIGQVRARFVKKTVEVRAVPFALAVNDAPNLIFHLHHVRTTAHCARINSHVNARVNEIIEQFRLFFIVRGLVKEYTIVAL